MKACNEKSPLVTSNDKKQDADENSQPVSSSVDIKSSLNNFYKSTIAPKLEDIGDSMAYFLEWPSFFVDLNKNCRNLKCHEWIWMNCKRSWWISINFGRIFIFLYPRHHFDLCVLTTKWNFAIVCVLAKIGLFNFFI